MESDSKAYWKCSNAVVDNGFLEDNASFHTNFVNIKNAKQVICH